LEGAASSGFPDGEDIGLNIDGDGSVENPPIKRKRGRPKILRREQSKPVRVATIASADSEDDVQERSPKG